MPSAQSNPKSLLAACSCRQLVFQLLGHQEQVLAILRRRKLLPGLGQGAEYAGGHILQSIRAAVNVGIWTKAYPPG